MSTSAVPAILTRLRDVITAAAAADASLEVVLSARPAREDIKRQIYVAWSGDSDLTMARFAPAWATLGKRTKNEPVDVPCVVVVSSGDDEGPDADAVFAAMMADIFVIYGLVETALISDPSLGRPGPFVASITQASLVPEPDFGRLRLPFTISVTFSRI